MNNNNNNNNNKGVINNKCIETYTRRSIESSKTSTVRIIHSDLNRWERFSTGYL